MRHSLTKECSENPRRWCAQSRPSLHLSEVRRRMSWQGLFLKINHFPCFLEAVFDICKGRAPAQLFAAALYTSCPSPAKCPTKVPGQSVAFCSDGVEASVLFSVFSEDLSHSLWVTVPFFIQAVVLQLLREMVKSPRTCWAALNFNANKDEKVFAQSFGMLLPPFLLGWIFFQGSCPESLDKLERN